MKADSKGSKTSVQKMTPEVFVQSLLFTAFKDYIGARVLINSSLIIQGLTLASSAIEKYVKAYLVTVGKKPKWVHLDNLGELKKQFGTTHLDVFEKLDQRFLSILGKAYAYRYFDQKTEVDYIGVSINQIIAELDYTADFFEDVIELYNLQTNLKIDTEYHIAYKAKEKHLVENNYLIEGVSKKEFMERPTVLYSLRINPGKNLDEQVVLELLLEHESMPYNGHVLDGIRIRKKGMKDH
jgi:HEPN domain-containing protein